MPIRRIVGLTLIALVSHLLLFWGPVGRQLYVLLAFILLPTLLWQPFIHLEGVDRWVITFGLVCGLTIIAGLIGFLLFGANGVYFLIVCLLLGLLGPIGLALTQYQPQQPPSLKDNPARPDLLPVGAVLLFAAALRLPWLGYKEIQGDEGIVLVRAAELISGYRETLFLHQKGPAEILIPAGLWAVADITNEMWMRIPFLLFNLMSIAVLMAVARRWFNPRVAWITGLLMACVGFHVAFGRIIQYQSIVVLMGGLALLAGTIYLQEQRSIYLPLASFFLAIGLLAHYDAVLFLPAIVGLIIYPLFRSRTIPWRLWGLTVVIGAIPLLLFYLPFVLNPNFSETLSYLINDRVGTDSVGNWGDVWRMLTFYNSSYYILGLIVLFSVGLLSGWRSWVASPAGVGTLLLAFVPLLFYTLIVTDPRTHIYTFFPGVTLVAAVGLDRLLDQRHPTQIRLGLGLFSVWITVSALYLFMMFTDGPAERQRNWETARPAGYWTSWDTPPEFGLFGFPYQAGWRIVGPMVAQAADDFGGVYASNEEMEITGWYTGQSARTHCGDYDRFILVEQVQDEQPYDPAPLADLRPRTVGLQNGNPKITLLTSGLVSSSDVTNEFAVGTGQLWRRPHEVARVRAGGSIPTDAQYGDAARLVGYDIELDNALPGGGVTITLYWQGLQPFSRNFQVFVQLYDPISGQVVGQYDTAPDCAVQPTTRWEPGQIVRDPHPIPLTADLASGTELQVLVGMYDLLSFERLPVNDDPNGALELTQIEIQ